jgi:hypothetical protein
MTGPAGGTARRPRWRRLAVVAGALVLVGLGTARLAAGSGPDSPIAPVAPPAAVAAGPSATAAMVCGDEVRGDLGKVLALPTAPVGRSTWTDGLFTCTYRLSYGPLVLSVKDSPTDAAARAWFTAGRAKLAGARDAAGLGEGAYAGPGGTVVVIKDSFVLRVDSTGLPAEFGPQDQRRTDLAYEVASVVLGCWTGDDD